jgi:hypothetical protein
VHRQGYAHFRSPALAAPPGAAVAGVIFSVLMIVSVGLVRYTVPTDLSLPSAWRAAPDRLNVIRLALDLVPFAGIAFLWFMGVLRNRLGLCNRKIAFNSP